MDLDYFNDGTNNVPMLKNTVVSFVANGSSDPDATANRGNYIASVTYVTTGKLLVTMAGGFYRLDDVKATIEANSAGDGAYASIYCADEQANPLTFNVFLHAAGGTLTNYTGRRVRIALQARDADFE